VPEICPTIQQLDPLLCDQNVGGFQIAMDDAFAVGRVESIQNLPRVFQRFLHGQRTLKRRAFDELHDQVVRPHIVQCADVRMIQLRHSAGFAGETLGKFGLRDFESD
jgi:hypothetical protein